MFPNVCKEFLIIYGCLKSTFKKVEKIEKKLKKKNFEKKKKLWKFKISLSQIFKMLLLSRNNDSSVH